MNTTQRLFVKELRVFDMLFFDHNYIFIFYLHLSIADSLADEIVNNKWEPKTNRKLEDIQKQYGISRTVAREATRLLASLGCVQFQRGTGVIACNPENWDDLNTRVITWKLHSPYRENELRALTELRLVV